METGALCNKYIAVFLAKGYTVDLDDGFTEARAHMDRVIARDVRFDIGGDRQRVHRIDTIVSDVTFKHILLPVWLAAYEYRGKTYRFVVNARTGRVQGERPYFHMENCHCFGAMRCGCSWLPIRHQSRRMICAPYCNV